MSIKKKLLSGNTALITGTSRGMGKSIAEVFSSHGCNLLCHIRELKNEDQIWAEKLSKKFKTKIEFVIFDLNDQDTISNEIKKLIKISETIDILVNNAGITHNSITQMTLEKALNEQMLIKFFSPYKLSQLVIKKMIRQKSGSIINIVSTAAFDGNPGKSSYGASKAALHAAGNSLANELGSFGIRVNSIAPGVTETDMLESMTDEVIKQAVDTTDLRRVGQPEEIANTALFLASDMSSYVTGQVIRVDGGM
ncbi:MAG: SDR family NAD(P)-dependent oxidoreductase [Gammaproteobacteria bacterium]